jgi:outer membrane lipoprotein-sorting protein
VTRRLLLAAGALAGALAVSPPAAAAEDLADQVVKHLAGHAVVRARFEQLRQSASLPKPVISSGRMAVSRKDGILWQIEEPVKVTIAYAAQFVVETGPDGVRRLAAQRRGAVQAEFARVMRSILVADMNQLRAVFQVHAEGSLEGWTLRLAPKTREMARFLGSIELAGARFLESIEIGEASGDRTSIRLRDFSTAGELDAAELSQFARP